VDDEPRVWKLLATMGAPTQSQQVGTSLVWERWVHASQLARLERAARLLTWELLPEAGEAVVATPTQARAAYEAARPFDPSPVLDAAKADAAQGEALLQDAQVKLVGWVRTHPGFADDARPDLAALDAGLAKARAALRERAAHEQALEARELAVQLKGVAGGDAYAAHAALKRLQDVAKRFEAAPVEPKAVPEAIQHFRGKLRPYQVDGVRFLLGRGLNAILADEMGLGKTIETIAAVEAADARAFVVGPANVLYNWKDEVERFTDEPAAVYHEGRLMGPREARFLLTTYDALQRLGPVEDEIASRPVLVLDEAHYIRNPDTLRAKLVGALPQKQRVLLTGTPMVNSIEDYYELLRQVEPAKWGTRALFRDTWLVDPVLFNKYAQVRVATANLLQRAARGVLLRRRKDDVLADLPPRTVSVRHHELSPQELVAYRQLEARAEETLRRNPGSEVAIFAAIHALRQALAMARVPVVAERVRELREAGEAVVVYAHYLEPLRSLKQQFGAEAAMLEGATPPRERQQIARTLGQEGGPQVLVAQMEAGGIGLNFTGARHVVFLHFGWTPAVHLQAMDRVHRIGQSKPVFVDFFVTPATIDERMVAILLRKEADQNLVLADESDVLNRGAVVQLLAEDAARRVREEQAVALAAQPESDSGPP
jgi:SNF2 family DNA or RNA helicase